MKNPMVFCGIFGEVIIIYHKNDMHDMSEIMSDWNFGEWILQPKPSTPCSSCFHSLSEIGDLKKAHDF